MMKRTIMKALISFFLICSLALGITFNWTEWEFIERDIELGQVLADFGKDSATLTAGPVTTVMDQVHLPKVIFIIILSPIN